MKTLYLYGPPASGKSTLARKLALETGRDFADLDEEIEKRTGRPIPDIFATDGEAAFRETESRVLREVSAPIVALGGGTLLDPENRRYAEERGMVAVLEADAATIAARIAAQAGRRPLGDMLERRKEHYASFPHRIKRDTKVLLPRKLRGAVAPPPSKSHLHRLLIAQFLAGAPLSPAAAAECDDIAATRRCIAALANAGKGGDAVLDVGESGSTLRFFAPIAAALGVKAGFVKRGRLAERPAIEYPSIAPGVHELRGDVSSQFATGLLFALPLLDGDSEIRFTTPLQSRGYVDMTLDVVRKFGIEVEETAGGSFLVRGRQRFVAPGNVEPERDWSGAAFWFAANAIGCELTVEGMDAASRQPDKAVVDLIEKIKRGGEVDVSGCPDNYPALAVVNRALGAGAAFTGVERLHLKESDRLAAMEDVFASPCDVDPRGDHRIAMAAAILSTTLDSPMLVHDSSCVSKSYPGFWDVFALDHYAVAGWPLAVTRSPELHNAAYARLGMRAEMTVCRAETAADALAYAARTGVRGMAVTIPHKEAVMRSLDHIDPTAKEIGAVNTIVFRDGRKEGFNTDERGFAKAICAFMGRERLDGVATALLGDGGAAKAVRHALLRLGANVETFHRRPLSPGFALIVNATPADPVPEYRFAGTEAVYDLRYDPPVTPLMARAAAAGCRTENGFSMLVAQADLQIELFRAAANGGREAAPAWRASFPCSTAISQRKVSPKSSRTPESASSPAAYARIAARR